MQNLQNTLDTIINELNAEVRYKQENEHKELQIKRAKFLKKQNEQYLYEMIIDIINQDNEYPKGTNVKIIDKNRVVNGQIISAKEDTFVIKLDCFLGEAVWSLRMSMDLTIFLSELKTQLENTEIDSNDIASQLLGDGLQQVDTVNPVEKGQKAAIKKAMTSRICLIWGPGGTGKTEVLSNIAKQTLNKGKRILMLSGSNKAVDNAIKRTYDCVDEEQRKPGKILRFGRPQDKRVKESEVMFAREFILQKHCGMEREYDALEERKAKLDETNPEVADIEKRQRQIKKIYKEEETRLMNSAFFIAITLAGALMDPRIRNQSFDMVIVDEVGAVLVPYLIFAAGLATDHLVLLGDYKQLPPIVQNPDNKFLKRDIFDFTGIKQAIEGGNGHKWLVLLDTQYRMAPQIADFVNRNIYHELLYTDQSVMKKTKSITDAGPLPGALNILDISDCRSTCKKAFNRSHFNTISADICLALAILYQEMYPVTIITFYKAQVQELNRKLKKLLKEKKLKLNREITISTVHQFQGSESAIVIYDCVDTSPLARPGYPLIERELDNADRLLNVAITRAIGKMIFVMDKSFFMQTVTDNELLLNKVIHEVNTVAYGTVKDLLQDTNNNVIDNKAS